MPREPVSRADEQVAVRHADASGGDIRENQHVHNRVRDIHVGKKGSEAASEEQPDGAGTTHVSLEYPASCETQDRLGSVLVQKSGHVDDDVQISALDAFYETDGRKSPLHQRSVGLVSRRRCRRSQEK